MTIEAILFDKDGTLIDFGETFDSATRYVLDQIFSSRPEKLQQAADILEFDLIENRVSRTSMIVAGTATDIATAIAPIVGENDIELLIARIGLHYGNACLDSVEALPKAEETLHALQAMGLKLGIATNDDEANARGQMEVLGFTQLFNSILGADSGYGAKPEPGMIAAFCEQGAVNPSSVIMVGDSTHDLHAGRAAGAITCAVETGPATAHELAPHADHVLPSIAHLPQLVERLGAGA